MLIAHPSQIHGIGLYAAGTYKTGQTILILDSKETVVENSKFGVCIDGATYVDKTPGSFSKWLNFSLTPNAEFNGFSLIALSDIKSGEEITYKTV